MKGELVRGVQVGMLSHGLMVGLGVGAIECWYNDRKCDIIKELDTKAGGCWRQVAVIRRTWMW